WRQSPARSQGRFLLNLRKIRRKNSLPILIWTGRLFDFIRHGKFSSAFQVFTVIASVLFLDQMLNFWSVDRLHLFSIPFDLATFAAGCIVDSQITQKNRFSQRTGVLSKVGDSSIALAGNRLVELFEVSWGFFELNFGSGNCLSFV